MPAGEESSLAGLSMLRLKIPNGLLNPAQLKAIARVCAEKAGGSADFAAGQEIHLSGIKAEDVPEILQALEAVGIVSAGAVPLEGSPDASQDRFGVHEQEQEGLFTLGFRLAAGRIRESQMRKAADLAERHGDGTVRVTARRNLLIPNIPHEKVAQVLEGMEMVGLKP